MYYAAIITAWLLFGALHSLTADQFVKQRLTEKGRIPTASYRLIYNGLALLTFVPVLVALWAAPTDYIGHWAGSAWVGAMLLMVGMVMGGVALRGYDLAEFAGWPPNAQTPSQSQLQQQGLLRYVRHPLYSAVIVSLLGLLVAYPDWKHLLFSLSALLYIRVGIHYEERKLICQFGDDYRQYRQQTPMLIPFLK